MTKRITTETKYFVHPSSIVDAGAKIGKNTNIWHFSHIMPNARIGEKCNIGQNVFVQSDAVIGNNVKIQNNVSVYAGVILEDDVFLGPSMVFTNVINPRSHVSRKDEYQTTLVEKGATIGANATVLCGIKLGQYCFIGAGAVVLTDVPEFALVVGNPAEIKGWMCQCGTKLSFEKSRAICPRCGDSYEQKGQDVRRLGGPE